MVCFFILRFIDEIEHENEHEIKMKRKKVRIKGKKEEEEEIGGTRPLIATHLVGDWTRRDASLKGSSYTIKRENKKRKEKNSKGNDIGKLMNTNSDRLGKSN
jgi:hypothetical protein